jgi:hypothetical protein
MALCTSATKIDQSLESLMKELGLNSGRDYGVAVHGNRMVSALVFHGLNQGPFKSPNQS